MNYSYGTAIDENIEVWIDSAFKIRLEHCFKTLRYHSHVTVCL